MLSRRNFLSLMAASFTCAAFTAPAVSARYRNLSGLGAGRFVWNPSVASEGPMSIVVSLAEQMVHVYRGADELAITRVEVSHEARTAGLTGLYAVTGIGEAAATDAARNTTWRGSELLGIGSPAPNSGNALVRLPHELAELLRGVTPEGALVLVAAQRSGPQVIELPGPFADEIETGSIEAPSVGRFAQPELSKAAIGLSEPPRDRRRSIIVSQTDGLAYVIENGRVVDRLPVAIEAPGMPLGTHAAMLLAPPKSNGGNGRWLAFGLDRDVTAAHIADDRAAEAIRRVHFLDRKRIAATAALLGPGSALILTDGPGPDRDEPARTRVALLTSDLEAPARPLTSDAATTLAPPAGTPPAPRIASRRAAATARRQPSAIKVASGGRRRGGAAPLDHREPWPFSMFWPY